jgi:hypothetical protein
VEPSADPFAVPVGTTAEPSAGLSAAPVGTRVRDGITAYRLDADREVFVLDGAYGPDRGEASVPDGAYGPEHGREVFVLDRAC